MSGTAYRRAQITQTANCAVGSSWEGAALPASDWSGAGQGLHTAQWDPGVATLASLVGEANLLLNRLSSAKISPSAEQEGVLLCSTDSSQMTAFPEEQLWGLLQKVRALQQTLLNDHYSTSEWATTAQD
ncbi:hypothetical protein [Candidatus Magnetaquicoccus inordinatus]|uniref:hypothetical protein n=1 Tax=Candidatus Magnetaquicoccus inordinatus TaxID=2496818 RepID=UPI00102BAAE2|nr:hypothetical protein [Candidatus Magnetaquicoccus inordinatus]